MFEIGFSELILVMIVGLIVLGPERLPVAVKTVSGWIRAMRSLASSVQNELTQELKLQELQDSLKKVEKNALQNLTPELKASMDELRAAAQAIQKPYQAESKPAASESTNASQPSAATPTEPVTIHNEVNVDNGQPAKVSQSTDDTSETSGKR